MIQASTFTTNLKLCWRFRKVQGDVVECGTWKGGMIAGMVGILGTHRKYHLFDSFEGLPEVKEIDGPDAKAWQVDKNSPLFYDNCKANETDAAHAMELSHATNYVINKGWFNETLEHIKLQDGIAILRLDGDWYDSTMDCLVSLFPKINRGGILIIDDYYTWEGCSKAVHDYLSKNKLPYRINAYRGVCYLVKRW